MKKKLSLLIVIFLLSGIFFINTKKYKSSDLNIRIDQIISKNFPKLEVYISVTDKKGYPISSLRRGNFNAFIDGSELRSKLNITGFQYEEDGVAYSLVLSANGMMEGKPIDQQQKAAINLFESLREQDKLSFYTFGEEVKTIVEFAEKGDTLLEQISKIDILGFNPHLYDTLVQTARKLNETKIKRKVIIIMSDGREVASKYNKKQVLSIINEMNIPVYSIGIRLMAGQNLHRIASISEQTGGGYVYSEYIENIPSSMDIVNNQITRGYVLKFKVPNLKGDDDFHQLQIQVNHRGNKSSFFKNFIATKIPMPLWLKIVLIILTLILLIVLIILLIIHRKNEREKMGITKRKCPVCKRRMKDDWDECVFCKYLPPKKLKQKEIEA